MCWRPLAKRQPGQLRHRVCVAKGQSNRFEQDRLRHVNRDTAECVDQPLEVREVDDDHVVDGHAGDRVHRADREPRPARLHGRVDLRRAESGDRDAQVARDRQVRDAVVRGIGSDEHHRVGVLVALPLCDRRVVGAEHEDRRRVRDEEAVLVGECAARARREPLVRRRDATGHGDVRRDRPDRAESGQHREPDWQPATPGHASEEGEPATRSAPDSVRAAIASGFVFATGPSPDRRRAAGRGNLALDAPTLVDAVGLLIRRHPPK